MVTRYYLDVTRYYLILQQYIIFLPQDNTLALTSPQGVPLIKTLFLTSHNPRYLFSAMTEITQV